MSSQRRRTAAALLVCSVLTAGCGLKQDTHQKLETALAQGVAVDNGLGVTDGTGGDTALTPVDGTSGGTDNAGTPITSGGPDDSGSGNDGTGPDGSVSNPTGPNNPNGTTKQSATTIGLSATELRIGIHAPLTGASPLPQDSFEIGKDLYWKGKTVHGRKVVVEVLDDTYKPSGAVRQCQAMARRDFIVLGGAGTDQIQACARDRLLQRTNTPYLSAGVTENGLRGIPSYFALSPTYPQQGPLVIENAKKQGFFKATDKWAVVISNTPNFKDAQTSIENALKREGVAYKVFLTSKAPGQADATSLSNELRAYNAPVVYFLGQPTFFINVVGNTSNSLYTPIWTGIGPSMGLNAVTEVACPASKNTYDGRFLHPYPGFDRSPADFLAAGGEDDIQLSLWLSAESLHQAFLAVKGPLTRETFMSTLERATLRVQGERSVVMTPKNHFGGKVVYSLKSDCSKREYVTLFDGKPLTLP